MKNYFRPRDHEFVAFAPHLFHQDSDLHFTSRTDLERSCRFSVPHLQRNVPSRLANQAFANMACSHKFSVAPCEGRIIDENLHANGGRIDIDELKRRAFLGVGQCFADINLLKPGDADNVTCPRLLYLNLLQSRVSEQRGDVSSFDSAVPMDTDD